MDDKPLVKMTPWYRGFKGTVEFKGINEYGSEQYINKGNFKIVDDTTVVIDELPIGKWTDDYKTFLESLLYEKANNDGKASKQCLVDFSNNSTEKIVHFTLKFKKDDLHSIRINNEFENIFKLTDSKNSNYSNIHLYNNKGIICKYDSPEDIIEEFYLLRLVYYTKRKEYMIKSMQKELDVYQSKIRFIEEFISGEINIIQKEDEEIEAMLIERNYPKFGKEDFNKKSDDDNEEEDTSSFTYEYLLGMKIKSLTKKKIEELKTLHANKLALFNDLMLKNEKDLWRDDLNKFIDVYRTKIDKYNKKMDEQNKLLASQNKKKQGAKKVIVKKK
jgi:DNA topoisomerase-2